MIKRRYYGEFGGAYIPEILVSTFEQLVAAFEGAKADPDFWKRGSLPHHQEIAVDERDRGGAHRLYREASSGAADPTNYRNQFRWRRNAATAHIRQAFEESWPIAL